MFTVDVTGRTPIFAQVIDSVREYIRVGILAPGDKVPSVRGLSAELGINPNTIQKAYDELVSAEILTPVAGKGMFVTEKARDVIRRDAEKRLPELTALVRELKQSGLDDGVIENAFREALK